MKKHSPMCRSALTLLLASALPLHSGAAGAEESPPGEAAPQEITRVIVPGKLFVADPSLFYQSDSKIFDASRGSSCNFMSAYNPNNDSVVRRYMRDFGISSALLVSDLSPLGDASTSRRFTSSPTLDDFGARGSSCGNSDRQFAAGRNRIGRKSYRHSGMGEGIAAFQSRDYAKATASFKQAWSVAGYPEAAVMLGRIYFNGLGTPRDTAQAIAWFKKVAEDRRDPDVKLEAFNSNYPEVMSTLTESCLMLAKIYMMGLDREPDPAQARKWYAEASELGYAPATNALAIAYLRGYGGKQDGAAALKLFIAAGEAGYAPAQYNAGRLYYEGAPGVPQDLKAAGTWFVSAAKAGHAAAIYSVARIYDLGQGVPSEPLKALSYYKEAALKNNPGAQNALATYFYKGEVVPRDLAVARKWFDVAARGGQPDAMVNLATMASRGEGGERDMAGAYVWLSLAKQSGLPIADSVLTQMRGELSEQDRHRADALLTPATASLQ
ncbi:MAG: SEL1-like repeat protein [Massilia sp.]